MSAYNKLINRFKQWLIDEAITEVSLTDVKFYENEFILEISDGTRYIATISGPYDDDEDLQQGDGVSYDFDMYDYLLD